MGDSSGWEYVMAHLIEASYGLRSIVVGDSVVQGSVYPGTNCRWGVVMGGC